MKDDIFVPFDILLPQSADMEKWAVIACDQHTSEPEYWDEVAAEVGDHRSALHLILPEAYLEDDIEKRIRKIHECMEKYLAEEVFEEYRDSFIYVERTLQNGKIRPGIVGTIDLEEYSYELSGSSAIRATERTVLERIPPRKKVREGARLESSHILLLCDDDRNILFKEMRHNQKAMTKLYDFELMKNGGRIAGWLLNKEMSQTFCENLRRYQAAMREKYGMAAEECTYYAVGDGNHSLAAAKDHWLQIKSRLTPELWKKHPARYAMVELENIHNLAQEFEPIHRIVTHVDPAKVLTYMEKVCTTVNGYPINWKAGSESGTIYLDTNAGQLPIGVLQEVIDGYLREHSGKADYIHGTALLWQLAEGENTIGFELPVFPKERLFGEIMEKGVLPPKAFSMGNASEKRYYLECRRIE